MNLGGMDEIYSVSNLSLGNGVFHTTTVHMNDVVQYKMIIIVTETDGIFCNAVMLPKQLKVNKSTYGFQQCIYFK